MKGKKIIRGLAAGLLAGSLIVAAVPVSVLADGTMVVTVGADLTQEQRTAILQYFGVYGNSAVQEITITNTDEREHLSGWIPIEQIGTRTISCALVKPTTSGGISVKTANLNYITSNMIASTMATSGITNCQVVAAAPFEVSGTGALTGIIMAYETATGTELDDSKKETAVQELVTTSEIAETVGQQEAQQIVNDIKLQIIEGVDETDYDEDEYDDYDDYIDTIVTNVVNNYIDNSTTTTTTTNNTTVTTGLSDEDMQALKDLAAQIAQQSYDQGTADTIAKTQADIEQVTGIESTSEIQALVDQAAAAAQAAQEAAANAQASADSASSSADSAAAATSGDSTSSSDSSAVSGDSTSSSDSSAVSGDSTSSSDSSAVSGDSTSSSDSSAAGGSSSSSANVTIDIINNTNLEALSQLNGGSQVIENASNPDDVDEDAIDLNSTIINTTASEETTAETTAETAAEENTAAETAAQTEAAADDDASGDSAQSSDSGAIVIPEATDEVVITTDDASQTSDSQDSETDAAAEDTAAETTAETAAEASQDTAETTAEAVTDTTAETAAEAVQDTAETAAEASQDTAEAAEDVSDLTVETTADTSAEVVTEAAVLEPTSLGTITAADADTQFTLNYSILAGDTIGSGNGAYILELPYDNLVPVSGSLRITDNSGADVAYLELTNPAIDSQQTKVATYAADDTTVLPDGWTGYTKVVIVPAYLSDQSTAYESAEGNIYSINLNAEFAQSEDAASTEGAPTLSVAIDNYTKYSSSAAAAGFRLSSTDLTQLTAGAAVTGQIVWPSDGLSSYATVSSDTAAISTSDGTQGVSLDADPTVTITPYQAGEVTLTISFFGSAEAAADASQAMSSVSVTLEVGE